MEWHIKSPTIRWRFVILVILFLGLLQIYTIPIFLNTRRETTSNVRVLSIPPVDHISAKTNKTEEESLQSEIHDERTSQTKALFHECFQQRFDAYWDAANRSIKSLNTNCPLETWVQHPTPRTIIRSDFEHTHPDLMKRLEGSCILLLGDSTDRQIIEHWCPRWTTNKNNHHHKKNSNATKHIPIEMWMPRNKTNGQLIRDDLIVRAVWNNAGLRCRPTPNVTIGTYLHYGVSGPPYWKFAHTYNPQLINDPTLDWGSTTHERILQDVPKFFTECNNNNNKNNGKRNVVVVQSYLWDLARQWYIYNTTTTNNNDNPSMEMIQAWAVNVTHLIHWVRSAVPPQTLVGWRYAGPLMAGKGRTTETILRMNNALSDVVSRLGVDFVADYGAILASNLTKNPFPAHPPQHPLSLYLNLLFNAIVSAWQSNG